MLQKFFRDRNKYKKLKIKTKEHNNRQNFNICIRNLATNKERQKANIFERKMSRRILGPVNQIKKKTGGY